MPRLCLLRLFPQYTFHVPRRHGKVTDKYVDKKDAYKAEGKARDGCTFLAYLLLLHPAA